MIIILSGKSSFLWRIIKGLHLCVWLGIKLSVIIFGLQNAHLSWCYFNFALVVDVVIVNVDVAVGSGRSILLSHKGNVVISSLQEFRSWNSSVSLELLVLVLMRLSIEVRPHLSHSISS
jgi:ABC-type branched-subunit amino acid transport system permease subunit